MDGVALPMIQCAYTTKEVLVAINFRHSTVPKRMKLLADFESRFYM